MQKDMIQSKAFRLTGSITIPILLFMPLLLMHSVRHNYSVFLANAEYGLKAHILFLALAGWLYAVLKDRTGRVFYVFLILAIGALIVPYSQKESLFASIHLLLAYAAFVSFQIVLWEAFQNDLVFFFLYSGILFPVFLITITYGQITGIAQAVYASSVSILISNRF